MPPASTIFETLPDMGTPELALAKSNSCSISFIAAAPDKLVMLIGKPLSGVQQHAHGQSVGLLGGVARSLGQHRMFVQKRGLGTFGVFQMALGDLALYQPVIVSRHGLETIIVCNREKEFSAITRLPCS
jgi:hypothetical protein